MEYINELFSTSFMSAVGWTVIHSMWMGLTVLAIVMTLQYFFARNNSSRRYLLAMGGHVVLLVLALATFIFYFASDGQATMTEAFFSGASMEAGSRTGELTLQLKYLIAQNTPLIAGLWLAGVALLLIKMAIGYRYVRNLRKNTWLLDQPVIQKLVQSIQGRLNINTRFEIRTTKKYMTPLLTGLYRPFIVLPLAVINSLELEEVELILAHEMAHLKRYDHVVVFIQQMIETLLYFNPAVWILSRQINKYREEACDDLVVESMGREINYAKSLVKLQELHTTQTHGVLALSALGRENQLLNRIKRIMKMENSNRNNFGRLAMVLLVPFALVLLSFYAKHEAKKDAKVERLAQIESHVDASGSADVLKLRTKLLTDLGWQYSSDTIPQRNSKSRIIEKITKKENGREVEAEFEGNELQYLKVDGERLSPEQAAKYQDIVDELKSELADNHRSHGNNHDVQVFKFRNDEGNEEEFEFDFDFEELGEGMEDIFEGLGENMGELFDDLGEDIEVLLEDMEFIETEDGMIFKSDGNTILEFDNDGDNLHLNFNGRDIDLDKYLKDIEIKGEQLFENMEGFSFSFPEGEDGEIVIRKYGDEDVIIDIENIEEWAEEFGRDAEKWAEKFGKDAEKWAEKYEYRAERLAEDMERRAEEMEELRERQEEMRGSQEELRERYHDAMENETRTHRRSGRMTLQHRIEKELKRDGLMPRDNNYTFKLKGNRLKINGKKQPQDIYEKYKDIYERYTGGNLDQSTYQISNTGI